MMDEKGRYMSLKRLARELDENTRQTRELVNGIIKALNILQQANSSQNSANSNDDSRQRAIKQIIIALQAQDRIEQRCVNMASAIRKMVEQDSSIDDEQFDEIWSHMPLDELSRQKLSDSSTRIKHGEVDLF